MLALLVIRRLIMAAATLFCVAVVVFILLRVVPGDPIAMMISPGASPDDIAALRARFGLDDSIVTQFAVWLKAMLSGDFGTSISLNRSVIDTIGARLPATLELAVSALVTASLLGAAAAVIGTRFRQRRAEARNRLRDRRFLVVAGQKHGDAQAPEGALGRRPCRCSCHRERPLAFPADPSLARRGGQ